jgi:hypothetical protein
MKVEKLKNKFETLVKLSGVGGDGDGDRSQAFYVIEAAMKREELQREGDELDAKIRKCEREIRALEQTLKHLTARNTNFRQSFQRADMGGDDAKKLKRLEEGVKQKKDELFKRKKELQHMQTDYEDDQRRLDKLNDQTAELEEYSKHLKSAHAQVRQELEQQEDKLARAQARVKKLSLEHRTQFGSSLDVPTPHEVCLITFSCMRQYTRQGQHTIQQQVHHKTRPSQYKTITRQSHEKMIARLDKDTDKEKTKTSNHLSQLKLHHHRSFSKIIIKTEYIRETTRNVVFTLGQLSREFPEITDTLNGLLQERNIEMPSRPPSRVTTLRGQGGDGNGYM